MKKVSISVDFLWFLIVLSEFLRFSAPLYVNPMAFTFVGAPLVQWRNAIGPLDTSPLNAIDPIFYPLWLSWVAKVTIGAPLAMGIYSGLLSAATPWVWYRFLREALPSKNSALFGWVLLGWLPSWIGIYSYLMPETVLLFLVGFSLWMTWRSLRKNTFESFVWTGVFWTASCLTKMTVVPLAFLTLGWLLFRQTPKLPRLSCLLGLFLACAISLGCRAYNMIGVWAPFGYPMHNRIYMVSGAETEELILFRHGARLPNLRFTSISAQARPFEPWSDWKSMRQGLCSVTIDLDHGAADWKQAFEENKGSLGRRLRLQEENMIFTLWGPSWPDRNTNHFWELLSYESRWMWVPLLALIVAANLWRLRKTHRVSLIPLITVVGWFCLLVQPVAPAEGRYRKPFEGLLIVNGLWLLAKQSTEKRD